MQTLQEKLGDLVNHDPKEMRRLGLAIQKAVDASRMAHPQLIGDHKISQAETKRRIAWCVDIALQVRFDLDWSLARICEKLPHLLDDWLEGTFEQNLKEKRKFFAKGKTPAGLKRAQAKHNL